MELLNTVFGILKEQDYQTVEERIAMHKMVQGYMRNIGLSIAAVCFFLSYFVVKMCCSNPQEKMNRKRKYRKFRQHRWLQVVYKKMLYGLHYHHTSKFGH